MYNPQQMPMGYYPNQVRNQFPIPPAYQSPEQRLQNYEQQYQQQYMQAQSNAPQQQNNSIVWVQGIEGAKSYLLPPNSNAFLMDSEGSIFYLKSTDAVGLPSMKIFRFHEISEADINSSKNPVPSINTQDLITREEFNKNLQSINSFLEGKFKEYDSFLSSLTQPTAKPQEGVTKNVK